MKMTASAKEFNHQPSRVLDQAVRGATVVVEKNGRPAAVLIPHPLPTSGAKLARRLAKMKPAPQAAQAVADLIKGMDEAD